MTIHHESPLIIVAIADGSIVLPDAELGLVIGGELPWTFIADERRSVLAHQVHGALKAWNDGPIECIISDALLRFDEVERTLGAVPRRNALHDRLLTDIATMFYHAAHAEATPKQTVWRLPGGGARDAAATVELRIRRAQDRARRWAALIAGATQTPAQLMEAETIAQWVYALADPLRRRWSPIEHILARAALTPGGVRLQRPTAAGAPRSAPDRSAQA